MSEKGSPVQLPSIARNAAWTASANCLWAGCQWLAILLIVKLAGTEQLGDYILGLAISTPVMLVFGFQLKTMQATDPEGNIRPKIALGLTLIGAVAGLLTIGLLLYFLGHDRQVSAAVSLIAIAKAVENISLTLHGCLQRAERLDLISRSVLLKGPLFLSTLFCSLSYSPDSLAIGLAVLLTQLICFSAVDLPSFRRIHRETGKVLQHRSRTKMPALARSSLPLALSALLGSLYVNVPRYIVEFYLGRSALGFFAALVSLLRIGTTLTTALLQSACPRLAKLYQTNLRDFEYLLFKLLVAVIILGISGIALAYIGGGTLLALLFTREFMLYEREFVLLMFSAAALYVFSLATFGLIAARAYRTDFAIRLLSTALVAISSILLVPAYAIAGGIIALGLTATVKAIVSGIVLNRLINRRKRLPPELLSVDSAAGSRLIVNS